LLGGGEAYVSELAHEMARRGHEVTVVTSTLRQPGDYWRGVGGSPRREVDEAGVTVVRLPVRRARFGRSGLLLVRKGMVLLSACGAWSVDLLRRGSKSFPAIVDIDEALASLPVPDLVHSFNVSWERCVIAGQRLAKATGVPHVITPFLHGSPDSQRRIWRNNAMWHQSQALAEAAAVLALAASEQHSLESLGVSPKRIHTVGAAVSHQPGFDGVVPDAGVISALAGSAQPMVLFVGRACRDKGALVTMKAVDYLHREGAPCQLTLAGHPSRQAMRMARTLRRRGVPIHLLGPVNEGTKRWLLTKCVALALPSRTDSFGLVLLEAWQHGKPVVVADVGGPRDVVEDGVDGLRVPWGDASALADALRRLLHDAPLCEALGAAGRSKAQSVYSWPAVADRVESAYRVVLAARRQVAQRPGATVDRP